MALSKAQIEELWISEGGRPAAASTAAAVALAESGGRPKAINDKNSNGTIDRGLFQVNSIHGAQSTTDLRRNVRAAIKISSNGRNWKPWVTYNTGAYKKYTSGGTRAGNAGSGTVAASRSRSVGTRTIPGVDNSAQRAAIQAQLGSNAAQFLQTPNGAPGSDMLDFAMQQRGLLQQRGALTDTPASTVTIPGAAQAGGSAGGSASDIISRVNVLDKANNKGQLPYKWGGGHAGRYDPLKSGPKPVDCSGLVSAALGINPRVASQFKSWGKPGEGGDITIYAKDTHVLAKVRGRDGKWHFFGTSHENPGGGAGWIPADKISPAYLKGFTVRHSDNAS